MAGGLTGDYDVVVEIAIRTVNRLLASIHQKGMNANASPRFPHSLTARVGDPPKAPKYQLAESFLAEHFGIGAVDVAALSPSTLATVEKHVLSVQKAIDQLADSLAEVQAAEKPSLSEEAGSLVTRWRGLPPVRGTAKIQVGAPTVGLGAGATGEVTVRAQIRVAYLPDPNTLPLPTPIHGEVRAAFAVKITAAQGAPKITVTPSEDNGKIQFVPAAGTPAGGTSSKAFQLFLLAGAVRGFLRTKFDVIATDLPDGFPFRQFKGLEAGNKKAVALPLMLSGQHIPALALNGVNDLFMATGDDFAIAISPYYVRTMLQPALEPIEAFKAGQKVTSLGVTWTAYSADVTNAIIDFESGALVLVVFGKVKVWGALISDDEFDFTVKQKFVLKLDSASQLISLQTSGGISIAGLPQKIKNLAKPKIEAARDNAVAAAQPTIQEALKDRRTTLNDALKRFDTSANAKFTAVEIDPEGIILRGAITLSVRPPAVVDVEEFAGGAALTAFKSWIPGGSVARFNWSWIKSTGDVRLFPWEGAETTVVTDPHRFTIGVGGPGQPQAGQRICLEIEGPQDGSPGEVSGGETCHVEAPWWMGAVAGVSSALAKILLVPVWGPDPGPDGMLEHAIVAHMNLHSDIHVDELDMPGIVHFATSGMAGPLPLLNEAVFLSRHRGRPIPVIVVLPRGSFAKPRRLLENQLGTSIRSFSGPLIITEDYEGGWAKAFGAAQQSATYLVRPSGEPIWRSEGLDRDGLTSVLDGHQFRSQSPGVRPSTFGVRSGEPAAEAFYTNDSSPVFRTLRGQRVEIAFWKSWSAPSVNELLRLQSAYQRSEARDGVLVAIGDGESPETVMEFGRKHGIGVTLVPDPERRISSLFRIHCWPSTISVDETGRIVRAHVGTSRR